MWTEIDGDKYIEVDGEYFVRDKSTPEGVAIKETGARFNRWFE